MNIKRGIAAGTLVILLASGGKYFLENNNPYNNKNIRFINEQLDDYSSKMERFIEEDFRDFERIMKNFSSGKDDKCTIEDIRNLEQYLETILTCNFKDYNYKFPVEREKSGFLINFENYFEKGSDEYQMVKWASEQYQKNIKSIYRSGEIYAEGAARECGQYYHMYEDTLKKIDPFARYIVLKLTRPILDLDNHNDYVYDFPDWKYCKVYLNYVDNEIERCLDYMKQNCKDASRYRY